MCFSTKDFHRKLRACAFKGTILLCHIITNANITYLFGGVSMRATTAPLPSPMGVTLFLKTHVTSSKPGVVVNSAEDTTSHPDLTTPSRSLAAVPIPVIF